MKLTRKPFYFMRHGQTDWNVQGKTGGHDQVPLNETGRKQAQKVQDFLPTLHPPISHVYYSPTLRAVQTEQIACKKLTCQKTAVQDLLEWDYGDWIGQIKDEYIVAHHTEIDPPHGEKRVDFFNRTVNALNDLLQKEENLLIVAHLGTYWALVDAMGMPAVQISNCQLVRFTPVHETWQQEVLISI